MSTIKQLISILRQKAFLWNVLLLSSGTLLGQAIMMLVLPILTRIYEPSDFGLLGVYSSILMVMSVAACMRLDLATPLANTKREAVELLVISLTSAASIAATLAVLVFLIPDVSLTLLSRTEMKPYLWMVPIGTFFAASYSAIQFWAVREKDFNSLSRIQLTRSCGVAGIQLGLGMICHSPFGLLFGYMLYGGIGSVGLTSKFLKNNLFLLKEISLTSLLSTFRKWLRFPIYSVPESLLDSATANLPIIVIASLTETSEAGYMVLANRVISIPVGLLGGSLSRVYLTEVQEKISSGHLREFTFSIIRNLSKIGIFPFAVIALISPWLFPYIFGVDWDRAGVMVAWLTPAMYLQFIVAPVSTILHATNKNAMALLLQSSGFLLIIGAILATNSIAHPFIFVSYASASFVYYCIYLSLVLFVTFQHQNPSDSTI